MSRIHFPLRAALTVCVLSLPVLAAAASAAGYLIATHEQRVNRGHRLAAAAAYVKNNAAQVTRTQWQQALTRKLAALHLDAELTLASQTSKRSIYQPGPSVSEPRSKISSPSPAGVSHPTATYVFPLDERSGQSLRLNLFARPLDSKRRLLVALACGVAALLAGAALLIWAATHWLVTPLRRVNKQVEAIAGGEVIHAHTTTPVREVENIATAVGDMAARLARTAEQDARVETERRLLVSSIAHDLRTPLFSLRGYLDAIASGIGDPRERLDQARAKAQQIDRLITGLFNYTRAETDVPPQLQTTDLAKAVSDTTAGFELAANGRGVKLRVKARAGTTVRIDRDAFERALANIIDNALRHTSRGGAIDVAAGEDADSVYVRVVDDGPGFARDLLHGISEPRGNADGTRVSRSGGAGLGLTIAAHLLRKQGGTIHAANTAGRGAILTLRLPPSAMTASENAAADQCLASSASAGQTPAG